MQYITNVAVGKLAVYLIFVQGTRLPVLVERLLVLCKAQFIPLLLQSQVILYLLQSPRGLTNWPTDSGREMTACAVVGVTQDCFVEAEHRQVRGVCDAGQWDQGTRCWVGS